MLTAKDISKYHSALAKKSHKKSPRSREHFVEMQRLSVEKRLENKSKTIIR